MTWLKTPHLKAVGLFEEFDHPTEGRVRLVRSGVSFEKTPTAIRSLPAPLGGDSADILREAGFTQDEIDAMAAEGVTVPEAARICAAAE